MGEGKEGVKKRKSKGGGGRYVRKERERVEGEGRSEGREEGSKLLACCHMTSL